MKRILAVLLVLTIVVPLTAAPGPCTISSDPTAAPCGEGDARWGPGGSWVISAVLPGGTATTTAYINGRPVSTASYSRYGGLTLDGLSIRRDSAGRVVFRDLRNGTAFTVDGSAASAARLNAYLRAYGPPPTWWTDLVWAIKAGWASGPCNQATLEAEAAAIGVFACGAVSTTLILSGCLAGAISAYFRAAEKQVTACQPY